MNRFNPDSASETIAEAIREDGYAIIEGLLDGDQLTELRTQIQPHLAETDPDAQNAFMGERTKRFGRLLMRVPMTRDMIRHPAVLGAMTPVFRPFGPTYQVHFTGVMHVMPGETPQVLHHDSVPFVNPGPSVVIATMWAGNDFVRANGATVFVPGSHKWDNSRVPRRDELRVAEMPAGSVLIYMGNLIHGAGKCVTGARTGVALQYSIGWLRQEENQYLAVPLEMARTFPEDLQKLMGYELAMSNWGYVDQVHALTFLRQDDVYRNLDPEHMKMAGRMQALRTDWSEIHPGHRYPVTLEDE